jgi:lysozyme
VWGSDVQARNLAIFAALAGVAGLAFAARREAAPAAAADFQQGDSGGGGDWGPGAPIFDAAGYVADALGGVLVTQQRLSYDGLRMLQDEEGFSATPYPDHKGYSIGYGHLIRPGEDLNYVTQAQAQDLLLEDVGDAERAVRTAVRVELQQSEFDALALLAYNIGAGAFKASTLVRKLNAGDRAGAAAEFPRWNMASGQVNATLVARRARERALFESEA